VLPLATALATAVVVDDSEGVVVDVKVDVVERSLSAACGDAAAECPFRPFTPFRPLMVSAKRGRECGSAGARRRPPAPQLRPCFALLSGKEVRFDFGERSMAEAFVPNS